MHAKLESELQESQMAVPEIVWIGVTIAIQDPGAAPKKWGCCAAFG